MIEEHVEEENLSARLNWLRAGVLGANDGVVSVAALLVGVAASDPAAGVLATAGIAGIAAGALSMGIGEYVSVSSQSDSERAQLKREQSWQETRPDWELEQLVRLNMETGMSEETARRAATEQHDHDPVAIHAKMHLGIDPNEIVNPWAAGIASFIAFTSGGLFPLATMLLAPETARIPATFAVVIVALAVTGFVSARLGQSKRRIGVLRNVVGGALAMAITYGIGTLVGTAV
ncbi:VIT1/CCC1 transporter family protein [Demequina sp.]|uniref:VIT1/CCC1 transporter family protein n=1 Tax=Demequina sp. TaxID=2050685 RepID=UPI003D118419